MAGNVRAIGVDKDRIGEPEFIVLRSRRHSALILRMPTLLPVIRLP
jgi:hypothetical protein